MRFLIFIYGKSRMKRTQLVSGKRAECHILLPKDDFSLERTVFLQFKNISGEWFIKETDCCHLKTEEFFQMGKRKSDEGIFYKLSIGRKNQFMNEAKQKIEIADSFKDKEDVRDAGGT